MSTLENGILLTFFFFFNAVVLAKTSPQSAKVWGEGGCICIRILKASEREKVRYQPSPPNLKIRKTCYSGRWQSWPLFSDRRGHSGSLWWGKLTTRESGVWQWSELHTIAPNQGEIFISYTTSLSSEDPQVGAKKPAILDAMIKSLNIPGWRVLSKAVAWILY